MYYEGDGTHADKVEAAKWYRLAAAQGDANSQTIIGLMCATGDGIQKDPVEALKWLKLSADTRTAVVQECQALEAEMSADQRQEVELDVQKFLRQQARRQQHGS
jgi:TPR repeat protein